MAECDNENTQTLGFRSAHQKKYHEPKFVALNAILRRFRTDKYTKFSRKKISYRTDCAILLGKELAKNAFPSRK